MRGNERRVHRDVRAGALMEGGRWIAGAGFAYVAAWLVGLAIGLATASPAPTDAIQKIGAYFRAHREGAMIQAYFLVGLAGAALLVFEAALHWGLGRVARDEGPRSAEQR